MIGCGVEGTTCPCGTYETACVPCADEIERVVYQGDGGIELNQDLIDTENGYFLNQEGDGRITIYTGQQTQIGVRVVTYFGRPAPGIPVTFQVEVPQGQQADVRLLENTATSNNLGKASITVVAPMTPTFFRLTMN